jgi:RNA-directed DNA polymerase
MDLSSSRGEPKRPPVRKTDTVGSPGPVKLAGAPDRAESSPARDETPSSAGQGSVWEQVFARSNLFLALNRVEKNAGAPGSDGLRVDELRAYLKDHWLETRASLDAETYRPRPVRRVEIPKPDGGVRLLGIPSVLDRLIQQALAQALTPLFEPRFSAHSYGFRPGRSAHQAVKAAQAYIQEEYDGVVDIDLEKFFDWAS